LSRVAVAVGASVVAVAALAVYSLGRLQFLLVHIQ
jgi:hypothetical protein